MKKQIEEEENRYDITKLPEAQKNIDIRYIHIVVLYITYWL